MPSPAEAALLQEAALVPVGPCLEVATSAGPFLEAVSQQDVTVAVQQHNVAPFVDLWLL